MLNKAMSVKNQTSELPDAHGDADNADIGKAEIKEDLCMKRQLGPTDEETSDSISSGRTDVTSSDGSAVEHEEELNVCDQVNSEEDEIPINSTTGSFTNCNADASFRLQNQRSHVGNLCAECGKCFTVKSSLIRHQKIHTRERAFLCPDCEKCFTTKSSLIRHQKIHTGDKEYLCSECGKCFTLKSQLISHQKSHTGEKAFSCSECGKCFTFKSAVNSHMKIHTGEKDFVCSKCGKCFTQQGTLMNHQKVHIKENLSLKGQTSPKKKFMI
ncbi:gastrula zinc finger protein XlCGF7.1-like isoform X1 [Bombina bombina]|uniref:gastrula zinc finger protein XlCGF7.1-like isoform X1 n=1 Tax=Bombina bombina TaxID=8345 RepID=UPI00235AFCC0|nr:gastrula zinc finger protein XlCGF7.1-like isoform X1 [Bombina bombina]XP_053567591.1 gastrula zinc finger protein XlCGF7.1-like isoform X1 [Bombina bombina]